MPIKSTSSSRVDRRGTKTRGNRTGVARRTKSSATRGKRSEGNRSSRRGRKANSTSSSRPSSISVLSPRTRKIIDRLPSDAQKIYL